MTALPYSDRAFGAFLFDMDGTLLSSIAAAERAWGAWATRHKLDVAAFLPTIHGRRASETIRALNLSGIDLQAEVDALTQAEIDDLEGIETIAGAAEFLASLPKDRWAIVTSAPRELARLRLGAAGLPMPPLMIAGEDITNGKPAPDCFLLAAQKLGQRPQDCLVFEDAPAGIQAAESAGASIVVVTATHTHPYKTSHPTVPGYMAMKPHVNGAGRLSLVPAAVRLHSDAEV
jgi:mannitol-1-/sugar-/sorbitol-6-phosphatase